MTQLQHRQKQQQQQQQHQQDHQPQQPGWSTLVGKTVFAQFGRFPFAVGKEECVQERRLLADWVCLARRHGLRPHQFTTWIRRKNGPNLAVWRQRVDGTLGCAAPCVLCQRELLRFDMRVHCTLPNDGFFCGRLDEEGAPCCKPTTGQMRLMFRNSGSSHTESPAQKQGGGKPGGREQEGPGREHKGPRGKEWFRRERLRKEQQRKEKLRREEVARAQAAKLDRNREVQSSIQRVGDLMAEVSGGVGSKEKGKGGGALEASTRARRRSRSRSSSSRSSGSNSSNSSSGGRSEEGGKGAKASRKQQQQVRQRAAAEERHAKLLAKLQAAAEKQHRGHRGKKKKGKR